MTEARRQELLHSIVDIWDHQFDPGSGTLPPPSNASCNLHYALALLETAERSRMGRAEALIARASTCALAPSPARLGATLSLIWCRHNTRFPGQLRNQIKNTIKHTARILRDDSLSVHTPPDTQADATLTQLVSADISCTPSLRSEALTRFHRLCDTISDILPLPPPPLNTDDSLIPLFVSLHCIENHIRHPDISPRLSPLLTQLWDTLALETPPIQRPPPSEILFERATSHDSSLPPPPPARRPLPHSRKTSPPSCAFSSSTSTSPAPPDRSPSVIRKTPAHRFAAPSR